MILVVFALVKTIIFVIMITAVIAVQITAVFALLVTLVVALLVTVFFAILITTSIIVSNGFLLVSLLCLFINWISIKSLLAFHLYSLLYF